MPAPSQSRRFIKTRSSRGAVIPLVALALAALMAGTAFSIDLGRLRAARRDLQADADFLALDAASVLDGLTVDEALPLVVDEANASAARNQYTFEPVSGDHVELGWWEMNTFTPMSGSQVPNAVRLTLTDSVPMYFDFSEAERFVTRTAIGIDDFLPDICVVPTPVTCPDPDPSLLRKPASRAELGSFLARLQTYQQPSVDPAVNESIETQLTFMNHIYSEFFDINVSGGIDLGAGVAGDPDPITGPGTGLRADAVSYQGLANGFFTVEQLADQLRIDGVLALGTVEELMGSTVAVADLLSAAATVLTNSPRAADANAGSILGDIATGVNNTLTMQFGRYLQASTGREGALETTMNAMDLLGAAVTLIDGRNFADVTIPIDLPNAPPSVLARVTVIEPPQVHRGYREAGNFGPSTAQVRVEVNIPVSALNIDLKIINGLLGVITRNGNIPLTMEVAKAESFYDDMACRNETSPSWTDLQVENSGVEIAFDTNSEGIVATAGALGLTSTAMVQGNVNILGIGVNLTQMTTIDQHKTWSKGVPYNDGLGANAAVLETAETLRHSAPYATPWVQYPSGNFDPAAVKQTFDGVTFNSTALLSGTQAALTAAIKDAYQSIMSEIDTELAKPIMEAMGVQLAGSDARIQKLRCRGVFVA